MRASLALLVLVVTWTVVAARADPTGTGYGYPGEPGETRARVFLSAQYTCTATCMYRYIYMIVHSTLCMLCALQRRYDNIT